jgi:DNA-binding CsgD family transcriptional regulator
VTAPLREQVELGRRALQRGDAASAREIFQSALADPPAAEVLEGLAGASYLDTDFTHAVEEWERAYAAYRDTGDAVGAVRVARTLAYMYGVLGNGAVMSGWLARAQRLLGDDPSTSEVGWVALNIGMFETDRSRKEEYFRNALEQAHRFGDTDLELVTLSYLGASLVHADRPEEGMVLLDEALAGASGREVQDFIVLQDIFCQLFSACEHAHDVTRAEQWIRIGDALAERRKLPAVSAFCHTHYGGILTTAGRWPEADTALTQALRLWGFEYGPLRAGALTRLAELRVRQGRYEEAEQLLEGLDMHVEAAAPLAALHLARSETDMARHVLERALDQVDPVGTAAVPLLALLVDVHVAADELEEADDAAERLAACAALHTSHYLDAAAALARGRVCLAKGSGDPHACLREALSGFARAQMPMELAHSRLALANAVAAERPEVAMSEARAALEGFQRLEAARQADAAAALLRSLGVRTSPAKRSAGSLTNREAEVLELLAHGLSNVEISDRLYISRKTVEHHVGNILAKLGLRSRAEAAAYATRAKPGSE